MTSNEYESRDAQARAKAATMPDVNPKRGLPARAAIALFTILTSCSLLTFSDNTMVKAQTAGVTEPVLASQLPAQFSATAAPVPPAFASLYYFTGITSNSGCRLVSATDDERVKNFADAVPANSDEIFKIIHDQVDFLPMFGRKKGSVGAILDRDGTALDQSELFVQVASHKGLCARMVIGDVTATLDQLKSWLGVADLAAAKNLLANGGVPVADTQGGLKFMHTWVEVINSTGDVTKYDPSFKRKTVPTPALNIASLADLNRTGLLEAAGGTSATIGSTGASEIQISSTAPLHTYLTARSKKLAEELGVVEPTTGTVGTDTVNAGLRLSQALGEGEIISFANATIPAGTGGNLMRMPLVVGQDQRTFTSVPAKLDTKVTVSISRMVWDPELSTSVAVAVGANYVTSMATIANANAILRSTFKGRTTPSATMTDSDSIVLWLDRTAVNLATNLNGELEDQAWNLSVAIDQPYLEVVGGVAVPSAFQDLNSTSRFDPRTVTAVSVTAGGYGADRGRALSMLATSDDFIHRAFWSQPSESLTADTCRRQVETFGGSTISRLVTVWAVNIQFCNPTRPPSPRSEENDFLLSDPVTTSLACQNFSFVEHEAHLVTGMAFENVPCSLLRQEGGETHAFDPDAPIDNKFSSRLSSKLSALTSWAERASYARQISGGLSARIGAHHGSIAVASSIVRTEPYRNTVNSETMSLNVEGAHSWSPKLCAADCGSAALRTVTRAAATAYGNASSAIEASVLKSVSSSAVLNGVGSKFGWAIDFDSHATEPKGANNTNFRGVTSEIDPAGKFVVLTSSWLANAGTNNAARDGAWASAFACPTTFPACNGLGAGQRRLIEGQLLAGFEVIIPKRAARGPVMRATQLKARPTGTLARTNLDWANEIYPSGSTAVLVLDPLTGTTAHLLVSASDGTFKGGASTPSNAVKGIEKPVSTDATQAALLNSNGTGVKAKDGALTLELNPDESVGAKDNALTTQFSYSSERALSGFGRSGWVSNQHKWLTLSSNTLPRYGSGRLANAAEIFVLIQSTIALTQEPAVDGIDQVLPALIGEWFSKAMDQSTATISNGLSKVSFHRSADQSWVGEMKGLGVLRQEGDSKDRRMVTEYNDPTVPSMLSPSGGGGEDSIRVEFVTDNRDVKFTFRSVEGVIQTFGFASGAFEDEGATLAHTEQVEESTSDSQKIGSTKVHATSTLELSADGLIYSGTAEILKLAGDFPMVKQFSNCFTSDITNPEECAPRGVVYNVSTGCDTLGRCLNAVGSARATWSENSGNSVRTFRNENGDAQWAETFTYLPKATSVGLLGITGKFSNAPNTDVRRILTVKSRRGAGEVSSSNNEFQWVWNSEGRLLTTTKANGAMFSHLNVAGRSEMRGPLGNSEIVWSDRQGREIATEISVSGVSSVSKRYEYDGLGRVVTVFFEESAGASWKAGCMGPRESRVNCWRTEYEYDDRGNVTKETKYPYAWEGDIYYGQIEVTEAAYSADFNKPLWVRGPYRRDADEGERNSRKTSFEYDTKGQLIKTIQPFIYDGRLGVNRFPTTEYAYDNFGRVTLEKAPTGLETKMVYGDGTATGQPKWCLTSVTKSAQTGGLDLKTTMTCTAAGDVATATDARGNTTTFTYDAMRRKVREDAPLSTGAIKRWIYDADGNVTYEGAWDGVAWKDIFSIYSPTGKVLTRTDPAWDTVSYTYDALDRLIIKTDPESRQVLTCYNAASQVLEEWRGTGLTTAQCGQAVSQTSAATPQRYVKNVYGGPNGAITEMYDSNNNKMSYGYQGHGRKVSTTWPDGKTEYHLRNPVYITGPVNAEYDRQGRLTYLYEDVLGRPWIRYTMNDAFEWTGWSTDHYDAAGNHVWSSDHQYSNLAYQRARSWQLDAADRVTSEWQYHSFIYNSAGTIANFANDATQLVYQYDNNGNRTRLSYDGFDIDYTYDALNRMSTVAFPNGNVAYAYDTLGRRTSITRSNGTRTDYAYETDSDLDYMREQFAGGATASAPNETWVGIDYAYDKSGRQTLMSATDSAIMGTMPEAGLNGPANAINQVASVVGRSAPMTWSDAGNMKTDGRGTTFTHDARNRLVRAVKADGTTMVYGYNTSGLRVESVKNPTGVNMAGLPTGGTAIRYLLSGSEEIADLDSGRNVIRRYIPGAGIDERVAQLDAAGNVVFIHNDKQNSVIAISNVLGAVIQKRAYGTYGETEPTQMTSAGLGTSPHPFGYTGRRYDPDLGLYYYRARWYDPDLGTFLQTDPIGALDYVNLYSYVGLEPGNATDPSGQERKLEVKFGYIIGNLTVRWFPSGSVTTQTPIFIPFPVITFNEKIGPEGPQTRPEAEQRITGGTAPDRTSAGGRVKIYDNPPTGETPKEIMDDIRAAEGVTSSEARTPLGSVETITLPDGSKVVDRPSSRGERTIETQDRRGRRRSETRFPNSPPRR
jgi:RHS repeat-associated protein